MYKVTNKKFDNWDYNHFGDPIVSLEDEYGGQSAITMDDHCFVLYNGSDNRKFQMTEWWHKGAVLALADFIANNPDFVEKWYES